MQGEEEEESEAADAGKKRRDLHLQECARAERRDQEVSPDARVLRVPRSFIEGKWRGYL